MAIIVENTMLGNHVATKIPTNVLFVIATNIARQLARWLAFDCPLNTELKRKEKMTTQRKLTIETNHTLQSFC